MNLLHPLVRVTFAIACVLMFIVGCSTTPIPTGSATPVPPDRLPEDRRLMQPNLLHQDSGVIVVTRDIGRHGCFVGLFIDDALAARFDPSEYASFHVQAGEHVLRVTRDPQGRGFCSTGSDYSIVREIVIRANETKKFRIVIDGFGNFDFQRTE